MIEHGDTIPNGDTLATPRIICPVLPIDTDAGAESGRIKPIPIEQAVEV